jgi:carbonic anhydrase
MLIYQSENERLALSIFFKEGDKPDSNLQTIIDAYKNNASKINVDLSTYFRLNNNYNFWSYKGSLTMPRCTDNAINWVVVDNVFDMSK